MKKRLLIALFSAAAMTVGAPVGLMAEPEAKEAAKSAEKEAKKASEGAEWEAKKAAEAAAKPEAPKAAPEAPAAPARRGAGGAMAFWKNEETATKLKLTDEQKAKLDESFKAYTEKTSGLPEKMRAAREAGDNEKSTALRTTQREAIEAHRKNVESILTEEQNKAYREQMGARQGQGAQRGQGQPGAAGAQRGGQRPEGGAGRPEGGRPRGERPAGESAPKPEAPKDDASSSDGMMN